MASKYYLVEVTDEEKWVTRAELRGASRVIELQMDSEQAAWLEKEFDQELPVTFG